MEEMVNREECHKKKEFCHCDVFSAPDKIAYGNKFGLEPLI